MTITPWIRSKLELEERASPAPWDDQPASEEWLANKPANAAFCRDARTNYPLALKALEKAVGALEEMRRYAEAEYREGDKGYQFAIVSRDGLAEIQAMLEGK
jgi:hypothetical protein